MSAKWTFWAWEVDIKTAPKKLALLQLANNADDDGKSWYAIAKMANACGVAERTFQRQIQSLENDGLLQVDRRNNRSCIYHLQDEMLITPKNEGDTLTSGGDRVTGQGDTLTDSGVSESRTILTIDTNNTPNKEVNSVIDDLFEQFWSAGMVKVNKKKALTMWKSAMKRSCAPERLAHILITDITNRLASNQFGFDKMHATTYLNGERWNDDISPVNQSVEEINSGDDWYQEMKL